MIDLVIAIAGLLILGIGLWLWIEPGASLAVIGALLFFTSIAAQFMRKRPDA